MSRGRVGATGGVIRRKALKPKPELSDAELLARAERAARRAELELERKRRAELADRAAAAHERAVRGARAPSGRRPSDADDLRATG